MKAFRAIHVFSLVAFLGAAVHGLFAGTDSSLPSVLILYAFTFGSTVLLMAYWLVQVAQRNRKKAAPTTGGVRQPVGLQAKPAVVRVERQR
jgi:DMSO/TMAO reductase YedYZ heme-binding membrane subunit